ncbi:MAG: DUF2974 domain-containing protein [Clostridia bacterium]|nr:DUF2974 domain-containing protein [Clostridia bacterium]
MYHDQNPRGSIVTYLREFGHQTFAERPFSDVDSLIFSQLSYLNFRDCGSCETPCGRTLRELFSSCFSGSFVRGTWNPDGNISLVRAAASCRRFGDVWFDRHVAILDVDEEEQFSAVTFHLGEDLHYIAYRGTDSSLVGWKEDFNLSFSKNIPSQYSASAYFTEVAKSLPGSFLLGGHSKGGNLAVYAAMTAPKDLQARIVGVYNHDGPGFLKEVFSSEGYQAIRDRIHKTVPQSAIIGLMLECHESYTVVDSDAFSFFQHDPFTWIVENGSFLRIREVDEFSKYTNHSLNLWLEQTDIETRKLVVDTLFSILQSMDIHSIYDLIDNPPLRIKSALDALKDTDPEVRRVALQTLGELLRILKDEAKGLVIEQAENAWEKLIRFSGLGGDNAKKSERPPEDEPSHKHDPSQ